MDLLMAYPAYFETAAEGRLFDSSWGRPKQTHLNFRPFMYVRLPREGFTVFVAGDLLLNGADPNEKILLCRI